MDDNNWDLYAVVRGCSAGSAAAVSDPLFSSFPLLKEEVDGEKDCLFGFPVLMGTTSGYLCELQELCKPFHAVDPHQEPLQQQQLPPLLSPAAAYPHQSQQQSRPPQRTVSQTPRAKRRKNQQKKVVCHVPADGVHSDLWAWRKYGQKPIKGSPYPRGYYRCSSSKGCQARKRVERSRAYPGMLLITYTAEHNHPIPTHLNSLAGSTRQKLPPPAASASASAQPSAADEGGDHDQLLLPSHPSSSPLSSPIAAAELSPKTPLMDSMEGELLLRRRSRKSEEGEEEEEEFLTAGNVDTLEEDDALFLGLDTVTVSSGYFDEGGSFGGHLFRSPWLTSFNAAAAAGGR